MPTIPELKDQARALGLAVGGNKATLQARISAHLGDNIDPATTIPGFVPDRNRGRAESVASTVSNSSAGGRKDQGATVLTQGNALKTILAKPRSPIHQAAYDCLEVIGSLPNPPPGTFTSPTSVFQDMVPLSKMLSLLKDSIDNMDPSSSHGENYRDLNSLLKQEWKFKNYSYQSIKPEVAAIIKPFLAELSPPMALVAPPATDFPRGWVEDTQEAIHSALLKAREMLTDLGPGETDPGFPSDEDIVSAISARGISLWRLGTKLMKKLNVTAISQPMLERLINHIITQGLANFDTRHQRFLHVLSLDEQQERDEKLRTVMPQDGSAMSQDDIKWAMEIHDIDEDYQIEFFVDVHVRGVITPLDDDQLQWALVMSNMPSTSGDVEMGEAGAATASTELPATTSALATACSRVKLGIEQYLRNWSRSFPDPEIAEWPGDFTEQERLDIRAVIKKFTDDESRNLVLITGKAKTADIDKAIADILALTDFPVKMGHTQRIVSAVLKATIGNATTTKKARAAKDAKDAGSSAAAAGPSTKAAGKRKRVDDEVEGEAEQDEDDMEVDEEDAGGETMAAPRRKTRTRKGDS